ncbi:uncharacterized protein B0H18DRAFT_1125442 [Fomitopsis serialis]|uniref:uncharacterized protein n=1 Tax=Fomitopsis serialis TaxID=139415 RepID=UPI0020073AD1|nr:uncharacterized protein B0H18DRAFT_1125442 [Neoantrodia serialis]KAH9914561.1 hypothetical protein B0H18DRAFT_1125442 [Neoantrodia serialis]
MLSQSPSLLPISPLRPAILMFSLSVFTGGMRPELALEHCGVLIELSWGDGGARDARRGWALEKGALDVAWRKRELDWAEERLGELAFAGRLCALKNLPSNARLLVWRGRVLPSTASRICRDAPLFGASGTRLGATVLASASLDSPAHIAVDVPDSKLESYVPIQQCETHKILVGLLGSPEVFLTLVKRCIGALTIEVAGAHLSRSYRLRRWNRRDHHRVQGVLFTVVLHPDACKKAQEEIDRVVGDSRSPDFGDRASLAYVDPPPPPP